MNPLLVCHSMLSSLCHWDYQCQLQLQNIPWHQHSNKSMQIYCTIYLSRRLSFNLCSFSKAFMLGQQRNASRWSRVSVTDVPGSLQTPAESSPRASRSRHAVFCTGLCSSMHTDKVSKYLFQLSWVCLLAMPIQNTLVCVMSHNNCTLTWRKSPSVPPSTHP